MYPAFYIIRDRIELQIDRNNELQMDVNFNFCSKETLAKLLVSLFNKYRQGKFIDIDPEHFKYEIEKFIESIAGRSSIYDR